MPSPSDGVMFDEASARRLVQSNRLVESNPNALYYDLPSGSMFDRPQESSAVVYDVLWASHNYGVYQSAAYRTFKTKKLWYILNLTAFTGLTLPLYNDPVEQATYAIHSFKVTIGDQTTDWITMPTFNPNLPEFNKELGDAILSALTELPMYNEDTFISEYIDPNTNNELQLTFGVDGVFTPMPLNPIPTFQYAYVNQVRYHQIGNKNQIISGPSTGFFINPFYLFVSNYKVTTAQVVTLLSFDRNYINLSQLSFIIGLKISNNTYVVAYSPIRVQFPMVPNWESIQ